MAVQTLLDSIATNYPEMLYIAPSQNELRFWSEAVLAAQEKTRHDDPRTERIYELPEPEGLNPTVLLTGTSLPDTAENAEWKRIIKEKLAHAGVPVYDTYHEDWDTNPQGYLNQELEHKKKDKVVLQCITGDTKGLSALAESGILALNAFIEGQTYILWLEDEQDDDLIPATANDSTKLRALVRAHAAQLTKFYPGLVKIAYSAEEAAEYAITAYKQ